MIERRSEAESKRVRGTERAGTGVFLDLNKKGTTNGLIKKAVSARQNKKRKIIAQMTKKEEPLHGQDLCSVPWENPPRVWVMLHESRTPSI